MNENEIKTYLKDHLKIMLCIDYNKGLSMRRDLTVKLFIDDEYIDHDYIPEDDIKDLLN